MIKEVVFIMCMLKGVVDSQNDGVSVLEIEPTVAAAPAWLIQVSNESFSTSVAEGDEVLLTAFIDRTYSQYCLD